MLLKTAFGLVSQLWTPQFQTLNCFPKRGTKNDGGLLAKQTPFSEIFCRWLMSIRLGLRAFCTQPLSPWSFPRWSYWKSRGRNWWERQIWLVRWDSWETLSIAHLQIQHPEVRPLPPKQGHHSLASSWWSWSLRSHSAVFPRKYWKTHRCLATRGSLRFGRNHPRCCWEH